MISAIMSRVQSSHQKPARAWERRLGLIYWYCAVIFFIPRPRMRMGTKQYIFAELARSGNETNPGPAHPRMWCLNRRAIYPYCCRGGRMCS